MTGIDNLIICNPYEMPEKHWKYNRTRKRFELTEGRRPAGFIIASDDSPPDDPGIFIEIGLVKKIRDRVDAWRKNDYSGITGVTRQLLAFWRNQELREDQKFFFCQLEAIETLIWVVEAPDSEKMGIDIPSDGGLFQRLCCKMATGTGKTIVMAMVIAWQVLNKATYPQDSRFSKNILVMAPGLTVKLRLQVLYPTYEGNMYDQFDIVPESFRERLRLGSISIHNWHTLMPQTDAPRSVVKMGEESNAAFAKRILDHDHKNIIVINDEAHHAYRATEEQITTISQSKLEKDKRWIEGLDRIHNARKIIKCFDFSATPFIPSGKNVTEETLFGWIVSDFSLNDAIESGLTKTPRIAIRDDSNEFDEEYRSRFYHIYRDDEVNPDLKRDAKETERLPDLVKNAYFLLGADWVEIKKSWDASGSTIPPVMITICNKTHTAARVRYSFEHNAFELPDLSKKEHLLHIDSRVLEKYESMESDADVNLRTVVDTVGKHGRPGEQIRNIVAVQMLSEGWDARNVTHIMGLRAFSSQLLCEQVVGRGLRRTSYETDPKTGLFSPEYVNVFGVPFTFLPHEGGNDGPGPAPKPPTIIELDPGKAEHRISWPNVDGIDVDYNPKLGVDWTSVDELSLSNHGMSMTASMAPILDGKPDYGKMSDIDLRELNREIRLQKMVFLATKDVYEKMSPDWKGSKEFLLAQVVEIMNRFINSDKIIIEDAAVDDPLRKKMTIMFNLGKVVNHVWSAITHSNIEKRQIRLNSHKQIKSTSDIRAWYTKKETMRPKKSHLTLAPHDSGWELAAMQELDRNKDVESWVKNDHIGFVIRYMYKGILHEYYPDFLIRFQNGVMLVLEVKGKDSDQNREKRRYLAEWVDVVNEDGRYGTWTWDVAFHPSNVHGIVAKHAKTGVSASESAKCPRCGIASQSRQEIERTFGFRNVDGIIRPQSWCRRCRKT